jgi:hypothetical protein
LRYKGKRIKKALHGSITEARRLRDDYLKEVMLHGNIQTNEAVEDTDDGLLFGELAQKWAKITEAKVKSSTFIGYRTAMNAFILPR